MLVETMVLARDESLEQVRIDLPERKPALQRARAGSRAPQHQPVSVFERETRDTGRSRERGRQRKCDPDAGAQQNRAHSSGAEPEESTSRHGARAVTVKTPPSLRPCTAGLYISSAWAGGRMNVPGVVARATYVAV